MHRKAYAGIKTHSRELLGEAIQRPLQERILREVQDLLCTVACTRCTDCVCFINCEAAVPLQTMRWDSMYRDSAGLGVTQPVLLTAHLHCCMDMMCTYLYGTAEGLEPRTKPHIIVPEGGDRDRPLDPAL